MKGTILVNIKSALAFLKEERKYLILLLLTGLFYGLFYAGGKPDAAEDQSAVKAAEARFEERVQDEGYWEALTAKKPWIVPFTSVSGLLFVCALGYGLYLNSVWALRRMRGMPLIERIRGYPEQAWPLRDLFRVCTLFVSMSVIAATAVHLVGFIVRRPADENYLMILHTLMTDAAVVISILYVLKSLYGQSYRSLGIDLSHRFRDIGIGFAAYCAVLPVFLLFLVVLIAGAHWLGYEPPPHPLVEILVEEERAHPLLILISVFLACVAGPVVEEVFFRGYLYPILKSRWGSRIGMLASAAVFSGIHQSGFAFLPVFVLGLALAYVYELRGTLIPSITLHVVHNSLFLGYFFFIKSVFMEP